MNGRRVPTRALVTVLVVLMTACGGAGSVPDASVVGTASPGATPATGAAAAAATTRVTSATEADVYRSQQRGELPPDGQANVGGVRLPSGRRVAPDRTMSSSTLPVLWVTEATVLDLGPMLARLRAAFPETGLWPLALESLDGADARPWAIGEFDPSGSSDPATVDVAATLAGWWNDNFPPSDPANRSFVDPFVRGFPGLAPAVAGAGSNAVVDEVAASLHGRLGLVAVTRPADVVGVIGFLGPTNYIGDHGQLSAVLRSWEDRFGAVLVGLGFDTMVLAVRHPPQRSRDAEAVPAEHVAVCPDIVLQSFQWTSVGGYAKALRGQKAWACWWD